MFKIKFRTTILDSYGKYVLRMHRKYKLNSTFHTANVTRIVNYVNHKLQLFELVSVLRKCGCNQNDLVPTVLTYFHIALMFKSGS